MTRIWDEPGTHGAPGAWDGRKVLVVGFGVAGFACADQLQQRGAHVTVLDAARSSSLEEKAALLEPLGVDVRLGAELTLPQQPFDVVVTSPGMRPDTPVLLQAAAAGLDVWGDAELAWRMRPEHAAPWLCLTGTNGKTTTVGMLESMLLADGLRAVAAGNVGLPLVEAVLHPTPPQVIAVELSSFQLHWSSSLAAQSAAVLNIAPDHLDWHGSENDYALAKGKIYNRVDRACVYNVADPVTERLVRDADVQEGARAVGFTMGTPEVSQVGLVEDILVDRAFVQDRQRNAAELARLEDLAHLGVGAAPRHIVEDALAAAALARSYGIPPSSVRSGLRAYRPGAHRIARVAEQAGVTYVDDSKATNAHAALSSLRAFPSLVWIAGGLAKGADFDNLVKEVAPRLKAVVLIGVEREPLLGALCRHAPNVPVHEIQPGNTKENSPNGADVMRRAVAQAKRVAAPGDVVLLAPACASMDQFSSYAQRGELFAKEVRHQLEG